MSLINEIYYFLQWYWTKQVDKLSQYNYNPALWHFTGPMIFISLYISFNEVNELANLSNWILLSSSGFTFVWYFIKLWFYWDWRDYQKEKQKTFDALKSDSEHL